MKQSKVIHKYDIVNEETGEIEEWVNVGYNPKKYRGIIVDKESRKPKKALESFLRIIKVMEEQLTIQENGMFYFLAKLVEWEDNFVQNEKGYLSIQEISDLTNLSRNTTLSTLRKLEEKGLLTIVTYKNKKIIYMYSRYVWFGHEKNRNDSKLYQLL